MGGMHRSLETVVWERTSSSQIVAMMQSTEPRCGDNLTLSPGDTGLSLAGSFLLYPEMSAVFVVIAHILGKKSLQMALIERDDVIEQITSAASYPTFGNAVLPWAPE
jgi:hypothetical protein